MKVDWLQVVAIIIGFGGVTAIQQKWLVPTILLKCNERIEAAVEKSEKRMHDDIDRRFKDRTPLGPFHIGDLG